MTDTGSASPMTHAIIAAAGKGQRMSAAAPKQYLDLGGRAIVGHALSAFDRCGAVDRIVLVVPEGDLDFCRDTLLPPLDIQKPLELTAGGRTRQDSVSRGLSACGNFDGIVVIHDGARPFVDPGDIEACVRGAKIHGACVIGRPCFDTLKRLGAGGIIEKTVERKRLWTVQTPQAFHRDLIQKALDQAKRENFQATDEAGLVERMGVGVRMEKGSALNIKITAPEDLALARAIVREMGRKGTEAVK
ncbi:2-C-methyl-D-erythritol 4-phosphate cytidylyltransferase [Candidatus Desulfarcum epimagneticum]|uniref:2-C-methyl-D-erythritol 4-phosphate cytidylyltransferase n=1 Tax=uncultured Desulfobacteraceae bacterium TaxID=218296 RepID=A0A484HJN6_9BACT|nr:2-C-methyl-D-erythritol 4-phosphate cytidylyltransferase [uncultured Desulfobacteraceae bacterium]